jgi:hypothetical protein
MVTIPHSAENAMLHLRLSLRCQDKRGKKEGGPLELSVPLIRHMLRLSILVLVRDDPSLNKVMRMEVLGNSKPKIVISISRALPKTLRVEQTVTRPHARSSSDLAPLHV